MRSEDETKIIYVNSYVRSGSTILGVLLGCHPEIHYLGEAKNFQSAVAENLLCVCGQEILNCEFWNRVFNYTRLDFQHLKTKPNKRTYTRHLLLFFLLFSLSAEALAKIDLTQSFKNENEYVENISALYNKVAKVSGKINICDTSHRSSLAKMLYLKYKERFKVIHLIRDGRGVVNSVFKRGNKSIKDASNQWKWSTLYSKMMLWTISRDQKFFLKYEQLCSNPKKTLEKLYSFLGVEPFFPKFPLSSTGFHFLSGSPTVMEKTNWSIQFDESWKEELTTKQHQEFNRYAGWVNRIHGYQ